MSMFQITMTAEVVGSSLQVQSSWSNIILQVRAVVGSSLQVQSSWSNIILQVRAYYRGCSLGP